MAAAAPAAGVDADVVAFYRARDQRPFWTEGGTLRAEAEQLLTAVGQADADGLDPAAYAPEDLAQLLERARSGEPEALAAAELQLSRTLAAYARDLREGRGEASLAFADPAVAPPPPSARQVLEAAAQAPSLGGYIAGLSNLNPIYARLKASLARHRGDAKAEAALLANMERARALPATFGDRFILVDAAVGRLWLYDHGQQRLSMKVVVGKPSLPTPLMAGMVRRAIFNPYWNVPEDLVRTTIADHVLKDGLRYLDEQGMEVFAGYDDGDPKLDPAAVDWKAVADGSLSVRVRQKPGPKNMMGLVKLEFPNPLGIYLHDTPLKELFGNEVRTASSGCVRLEDAMALARLVLGDATPDATDAEHPVELAEPVPVYITYLTAAPTADGLDLRPDVYSRDAPILQKIAGRAGTASGR